MTFDNQFNVHILEHSANIKIVRILHTYIIFLFYLEDFCFCSKHLCIKFMLSLR